MGYFFDTPLLGGNTGLELEVYHLQFGLTTHMLQVGTAYHW